jgi:cytochrome P450
MIERTIMQFFIDGFDTVASFTGAIVYMIGTNPEVQVLK